MGWGEGSVRERRPGVWELRIAAGRDALNGRTLQRSFTFYGDRDGAETRSAELAAQFTASRRLRRPAPFLTLSELLDRWLAAHHDWAPSTWSSYGSNARALRRDRMAGRQVSTLTPELVSVALVGWREGGASSAVVSGRFRTLRAALGWGYEQRIIESNPLDGMRGPPQPGARMHVPPAVVARLIRYAEAAVEKARADSENGRRGLQRLHRAEQDLLLARLAADSGARRGELAALQIGDLDGRVLTICRGASMEQVGPTKTRRVRRLTLGTTTAALWSELAHTWASRVPDGEALGEWLFSRSLSHTTRLSTSHLAHSFAKLRTAAGVPDVSLHRLRHSEATFLVGRGDLLRAQYRLGHREASTTLRNYAHAMPLEDEDAADAIETLLTSALPAPKARLPW